MKHLRLAFLIAIVGAIATSAQAAMPDFCMDCSKREVRDRKGVLISEDAVCCMANDNGRCFGGYFVVDVNVGWDCKTEPSDQGTRCASGQRDLGCGDAGGAGNADGGPGPLQDGVCINDGSGCSAECASCTWV